MVIDNKYKEYEFLLYNIDLLKEFFRNNRVIAYGNGNYYIKVKEFLEEFNLVFYDVLYTKDSKIFSISGREYETIIKDASILICSSFYEEIINLLEKQKIQLRSIKISTFVDESKLFLDQYINFHIKKVKNIHKKVISNIKIKNKIKVVFLVIHKSMWKVDSIFNNMMEDPFFEPLILICPNIKYKYELMVDDMGDSFEYFEGKNYPVISSYDIKNNKWLSLTELMPDLVFFTNPYNLTRREYYNDAFRNYLSCYVPYFYLMTTHDDDQPIYNQVFHNLIWKIFLPHQESLRCTKKTAVNRGKNALVTGYPFCEDLLTTMNNNSIWKKQDKNKIKIIYAPHHTIGNDIELRLSTFLKYAIFFKELSIKLKDEIQWCFKPHPILKSKLYGHLNWGKEKTDKYYEYWQNSSNTQFENGEYIELFKQSDCMIHDSGSFLVEYLFVQKPVLYLMTEYTKMNLNEFGLEALKSCSQAYNEEEIKYFIYKLRNNYDEIKEQKKFIKKHIKDFFIDKTPSKRIISYIKNHFNKEIR